MGEARTFYLLDRGMRKQPLSQGWSCQALSDNEWIVSERFKEFAQHVGLIGVLCHAIHLSL
jgi:hypothetical protein